MEIKQENVFDKIKRNNPYFEDFITRSIYNSNAIEGNTMSYAETYSIVFNDNSIKINSTAREIYEAVNLKYAFNYILKNLDKDTNINTIKKIGILINKNIKDISGFRTGKVFIKGAVHIPPDACYVVPMLNELVYNTKNSKEQDIFKTIASFHIQFERIHPFSDGNGRTGRLLITKELLKNNQAPIVIPFELRNEYMSLLANQDINGLANMLRQLNIYEKQRMSEFGIKI